MAGQEEDVVEEQVIDLLRKNQKKSKVKGVVSDLDPNMKQQLS